MNRRREIVSLSHPSMCRGLPNPEDRGRQTPRTGAAKHPRTGALDSWAKNELLSRVGDPDIFGLAAVMYHHGAEGPGTQSLCQSCNTRR